MAWLVASLGACDGVPDMSSHSSLDAGATDGSNGDANVGFDATLQENPYNLVFMTSTSIAPGALGGLIGGDAFCNERAQAAGLPGTYVAWLSTSTVASGYHVGNARGWVRMDGKPLADTLSDLLDGTLWYPILFDENGVSYAGSNPPAVATGSGDGGYLKPGHNCMDWTSIDSTLVVETGRPTYTTHFWSEAGELKKCNVPMRLYCFGVSKHAALVPTKTNGPLAFLSTSWTVSGGLAGADARCQSDATAAGKTGTFKALLPTSTASAASRFSSTGDVWVLADGLPIAATRAAVFADSFDRGISMTAAGQFTYPWTFAGAYSPNDKAMTTYNCKNWTSSGSDLLLIGEASGSGEVSFGYSQTGCSITASVYCLQTP